MTRNDLIQKGRGQTSETHSDVIEQKYCGVEGAFKLYCGRDGCATIPYNVRTKIEQFLSLTFCFISPVEMQRMQKKINSVLQ